MVENVQERADSPLAGRTLYIPQMAYAGARLTAAGFRSVGIDAQVAPDSDGETLELGGLHTSGEECFPHKVTVGDFLKVCRAPGFDPARVAFLMPTAHGPCRFGQYAPYLRQLLDQLGYQQALVFSPTSANGYDGFGAGAAQLIATLWMGLVAGDICQKLVLKTRPYETTVGDADAAFEQSIGDFAAVLSIAGLGRGERLARMVEAAYTVRDRFRAVPARYQQGRPLIGLVGEIFCRMHTFSNMDTARRVERLGGECWISDIAEWVWYANWYSESHLVRNRGRLNADFLKMKIKTHMQHRYEQAMNAPLAEDFRGYEEPRHVRDVLQLAEPYLPAEGAIGEMVLSTGKSIYLHRKGIDGILDISPFTCMNGIVCEAVYPSVSADHDNLPIRVLYFDGANTSIDRDLDIFLDLARSYQRRKKHPRTYPGVFSRGGG